MFARLRTRVQVLELYVVTTLLINRSLKFRNSKFTLRRYSKIFNSRLGACSVVMLFRTAFLKLKDKKMSAHHQQDSYSNKKHHNIKSAEVTSKKTHTDWLNHHRSAEDEYDYVVSQCFNESQDVELLWRFGRACYGICAQTNASRIVKASVVRDGQQACGKAVELDPNHSIAFMWLGRVTGIAALLCSHTSPLESSKMALETKEYLKHATELDPRNHEAWFSLGIWYYNVLTLPFYQRIIFYKLTKFKPDVNDGITMLKTSNKVRPQPLTSLYIAKCYLYVNNKNEAKKWLESATNFKLSEIRGADQIFSITEATQLLSRL